MRLHIQYLKEDQLIKRHFLQAKSDISAHGEDAALRLSLVAGAGENLENTMAAFKQ